MEQMIFNLDTKGYRYETLDARKYLVCNVSMLAEGVWPGNAGPVFYSQDLLERSVPSWNNKPLVVNHPTKDGQPASAANRDVLEEFGIGFLLNTIFLEKLKAESWVDEEKCLRVEPSIVHDIKAKKKVEVSTSLHPEVDKTPGEWKGTKYVASILNMGPDHLAVLTKGPGAYSVADGGGLLANEMSMGDVGSGIRTQLYDRFGYNVDVEDIFNKYVIYTRDRAMYKLPYSNDGKTVKLSDSSPVEVVYVPQYQTIDGTIVGNGACKVPNKEKLMDKTAIVNALIASGSWEEADRDFLTNKMEDAKLTKLHKMLPAKAPEKPVANATVETPPVVPVVTPPPVLNNSVPVVKKDQTPEEYLADAPPAIRALLGNALKVSENVRSSMIKTILENAKDVFTEDYLKTRNEDELQGILTLATRGKNAPGNKPSVLVPGAYALQAGAPPVANDQTPKITPVVPMVFNWKTEKMEPAIKVPEPAAS